MSSDEDKKSFEKSENVRDDERGWFKAGIAAAATAIIVGAFTPVGEAATGRIVEWWGEIRDDGRAPAAQQALRVKVTQNPDQMVYWAADGDGTLASSVSQADSLSEQGQHDWFQDRGAVQAIAGFFRVDLSNGASETLRITNLRLESDCKALSGGSFFYSSGASQPTNIPLVFDATTEAPPSTAEGPEGVDYFGDKSIQLKAGEQETLQLQINADAQQICDADIFADIIFASGKSSVESLNDSRVPFRFANGLDAENVPNPSIFDRYLVGGLDSLDAGGEGRWVSGQ